MIWCVDGLYIYCFVKNLCICFCESGWVMDYVYVFDDSVILFIYLLKSMFVIFNFIIVDLYGFLLGY